MSIANRVIVASFALLLCCTTAAHAQERPPGVHVERLYNGVDRPVMVDIVSPNVLAPLSLAVMDPDGGALLGPVEVLAGKADLAVLMPDIWRIRRAAYLQLIANGTPTGSALVLQPMLSRLVPQEVEAMNPNGIRYTRIEGWRDETLPPLPVDGEVPVDERVDDVLPGMDGPEPWLIEPDAKDRLFGGLRIYPERDVLLRTDHGDMRFLLRPDHAPNTAWNFRHLAEGGFYHGIPFHRIVPATRNGDPFVIQAGDPTPSGSGGPGYWLPMERSFLAHDFGVISMARDFDPDSAGSQIFVCLSRAGTARLDGHYCAFGELLNGAEAVESIAGVALADIGAGKPEVPPMIIDAVLMEAPARVPGAGRPDRTRVSDDDDPNEGATTDGGRAPRVPR